LTVAGAQAADLPTRKAAPVNYVHTCDAYGAGFFYIPGTDTCLEVGGLALFEARIFNTPYSIGAGFFSGQSPGALTAGLGTPLFFTPGGGAGVTTGDAADRHLPSEFEAKRPAVAQHAPEDFFRIRHSAAQFASISQGAAGRVFAHLTPSSVVASQRHLAPACGRRN
jgi:Porin subfamily